MPGLTKWSLNASGAAPRLMELAPSELPPVPFVPVVAGYNDCWSDQVVEADSLFVACPRCSAWPMAAGVAGRGGCGSLRDMRFRCPRCGQQVIARLTKAHAALEASHAKPEATVDR
jgi:uncharacterized C2H2 Zn-finger protein